MIEFDWLIHYRCNYRCPYCFFDGMWDEVETRNRAIEPERWIGAWRRIHERYGALKIIITGGEPFLYPGYIGLLAALGSFAELSFDTNLSCPKETVARFADRVDPRNVFLGLSFHPTGAGIDEFLEKAALLSEKGFSFRVHYVTYPPHLARMPEARERVERLGFRFAPLPFRGVFDGKRYPADFTDGERALIGGVAREIAPTDRAWTERQLTQTKSRDKRCRAGQHYARVDCDGTVYPCGNDYTNSREKCVLGNVLSDDFSLREQPMICRQDTCPCEFRWLVDDEGARRG